MKETGKQENALARLLREPLTLTRVGRAPFAPGMGARDEVVTTSRLILILRGELTYTIERTRFPLEAGTQFFVPAWVRRLWAGESRRECELIWFEFDSPSLEDGRTAFYRRRLAPAQAAREKSRYLELGRLCPGAPPEGMRRLAAEGLMKAMLARFWMEAEPPQARPEPFRPPHPCVRRALRWLEHHFQERDVLEKLYALCGVTPNYFRRCFKEALLCSPRQHIERLRLRRARFLLWSTGMQQKRIALEVGYGDPLYFSRLYRRFWGRAPSAEARKIQAV